MNKAKANGKNNAELEMIALERIIPSPTNPRKRFDDEKLNELAASIKRFGVLEPILVRPAKGWAVEAGRESGKPGYFVVNPGKSIIMHDSFSRTAFEAQSKVPTHELVAGERRWRAAKLAGNVSIRAIVKDLSDKEALEIQIVENEQRDDVAPLEKAEGYGRLIDQHGYSAELVAERIGKSKATVYGLLKLRNLPIEAKQAIDAGRLSLNHGILIGRIPNEAMRAKATARILEPKDWAYRNVTGLQDQPLSYREAKTLIEEEFSIELKGAPFDRKSLALVPGAGSCEACPKMTGNNRADYPDARADVCTDPECFRTKAKAHQAEEARKAEAKGKKVMAPKEAKKAIDQFGNVRFNSGWLDLAGTCLEDPEGRTYKQLAGAEIKEETYLAYDGDSKAYELAPKARVFEVLEEKGIRKRSQTQNEGPTDWKAKREKEEREREAVSTAVARAVIGSKTAKPSDVMKWLFLRLADSQDIDALALAVNLEKEANPEKVLNQLEAVANMEMWDVSCRLPALMGLAAIEMASLVYWGNVEARSKEDFELFGIDYRDIRKAALADLKKEKAQKSGPKRKKRGGLGRGIGA